jgi:hypothetical protein
MAHPRPWERGDGRVLTLAPVGNDRMQLRNGQISPVEYFQRFTRRTRPPLGPGHLYATRGDTIDVMNVAAGDTLCCACSRENAAVGCCHRVWAAELLRLAGWDVLLDGAELHGVETVGGLWVPLVAGGQGRLF